MSEQTKGAVALDDETLEQAAGGAGGGGGAGKVSMNDLQRAGDPSQWGLAKKGSFDITE